MASDGFDSMHLLSFMAGVVLTFVAAATYYFLVFRRQTLAKRRAVCRQSKAVNGASHAWPDPEKGESQKPGVAAGNSTLSNQSTQQLCETFRALLQEEISKGLHAQDISDRMARLEKQLAEMSRASEGSKSAPEAMPPVGLRGAAAVSLLEVEADGRSSLKGSETQTPGSSDRSGSSSERDNEDLPGVVATPPDKPSPAALKEQARPPPAPPAELNAVKAPPPGADPGPPKMFGPTDRQNGLPDPPEKSPFLDEDESDRNSMATLQRILGKRDAQTTELHRQLRTARQQLWQQTQEARAAKARLNAYLSDTSKAPQAQADAIARLQEEVQDLSGRLAETRQQEQHWSAIAKRQRAFFQQSERMSQDGMSILRRHPAGDVFLAPPPVVLDDDEPRDEPMWDVGTSHCNPYCVDSWPFEPNVLAARASAQPNLNRWEEGSDEEYEEDGDEDDDEDHPLQRWGCGDHRGHQVADDDEEDEEMSEGRGGWGEAQPMQRHGGLPPLPVPAGGGL